MDKIDNLGMVIRRMTGVKAQGFGPVAKGLTVTTAIKTSEKQPEDIAKAATSGQWLEARVVKWITERGFGFVRVHQTEVFPHCSTMTGNVDNLCNERLFIQVEPDKTRGVDKYRVKAARRQTEHEAATAREKAEEEASRAA